jgi:hypothetical protein
LTAAVARRLLAAVVAVFATAAAAVPVSARQSRPATLLDVPYVPQSEELCGGAAVAMVMRYWGATGIHAESFASLVDRQARGIKGEDLLGSLRERGWTAVSFGGDAALVQRTLQHRQPPIALIEDRPGRFHYVVLLSWAAGTVVVHDPARAPFRVLRERDFERAWSRANFWTLVALPGERGVNPAPAPEPAKASIPKVTAPTVCGGSVDDAVRLANDGDIAAAARLLERATVQCPGEAAGWRELAGLHAVRKDWPLATDAARKALSIDGSDDHAARILATSLYLRGESNGALDAWNRVGEPALDLVEIRGIERTRFSIPFRAMRLPPQTLLTAGRLTRAARRLDAIPAFMGSRVTYTPRDEGLAQVTGAVVERPVLPLSAFAVAATGLRAATDRELRVAAASVTGGGELWHAAWRWWDTRPRVSLGLDAPAPFGGTLGLSAVVERETFGEGTGFQQRRRIVTVSASDWLTGRIRWEVAGSHERWPGRTATGLTGGLRYQTVDDRFTADTRWTAWGGAWGASAGGEWRSRARSEGHVWLTRGLVSSVSRDTPLALWNGAGTGQARDELLRAHPLLHDGILRGGVFGRRLAAAGLEWRRWGAPVRRVLRLAPAAFIDAAKAGDAPAFADHRAHADVGVGLRLAIPGAGVLRADVARGLRDGEMAVSFGWGR